MLAVQPTCAYEHISFRKRSNTGCTVSSFGEDALQLLETRTLWLYSINEVFRALADITSHRLCWARQSKLR